MAIRLSDTELLVTIGSRSYVMNRDDVDAIGGKCWSSCQHCGSLCDQLEAAEGHGHTCIDCRNGGRA